MGLQALRFLKRKRGELAEVVNAQTADHLRKTYRRKVLQWLSYTNHSLVTMCGKNWLDFRVAEADRSTLPPECWPCVSVL